MSDETQKQNLRRRSSKLTPARDAKGTAHEVPMAHTSVGSGSYLTLPQADSQSHHLNIDQRPDILHFCQVALIDLTQLAETIPSSEKGLVLICTRFERVTESAPNQPLSIVRGEGVATD